MHPSKNKLPNDPAVNNAKPRMVAVLHNFLLMYCLDTANTCCAARGGSPDVKISESTSKIAVIEKFQR